MTVLSANISHRSFVGQITTLCFLLGLLLAAAAFTVRQYAASGAVPTRAGFAYGTAAPASATMASEIERYQREIRVLNLTNQKLEDKTSGQAKTLNAELTETKILAGYTAAEGPGVQVTLVDSTKKPIFPSSQVQLSSLIHDTDIAAVVNEMKAAGAEAVAVNGQRVTTLTAIRCVGPSIQINGNATSPPYVLTAIGDPDALYGGLNLPSGVLDGLRQFDPSMVRIEKRTVLHVPAFIGVTHPRFAKPDPDAEREQDTTGRSVSKGGER